VFSKGKRERRRRRRKIICMSIRKYILSIDVEDRYDDDASGSAPSMKR
jgi:hypothetical protein